MDALTLEVVLVNTPDQMVEAYGVFYHARCVSDRIRLVGIATASIDRFSSILSKRSILGGLGGVPQHAQPTLGEKVDAEMFSQLLVDYHLSERTDVQCSHCADKREREQVKRAFAERQKRHAAAMADLLKMEDAMMQHQLDAYTQQQAMRMSQHIDNSLMQQLMLNTYRRGAQHIQPVAPPPPPVVPVKAAEEKDKPPGFWQFLRF